MIKLFVNIWLPLIITNSFIYAGKQYAYDSDFNFSRYYETGVDKAQDFIEPGVAEKSVIFFKPIPDVEAINIVLNANFEDYRYNNVKVSI